MLTVGVPRETKPGETRVAITPEGVHELVSRGVRVLVEAGAGVASSITNDKYLAAGAEIATSASEVWERSKLVCKVKEPQHDEYRYLNDEAVIFTYLHLAAYPELADALLERRVTSIGYETVTLADGSLPLLAPMSEVAGRMAPQVGAHFLEKGSGGRGVLLGGAPGVHPGRVVVIGAGVVGTNAAWISQGMEAEVILLDRETDKLRHVDTIHRGRIMTVASTHLTVHEAVRDADLVIGAALVAGGRAPVLITRDLVKQMKPGSVIVDIAVDQGGIAETTVETSHSDPVLEIEGVLHYGVGNMPAAVPHTSTYALTNATLRYVLAIATTSLPDALRMHPELRPGVNTAGGLVVNEAVATALGKECTSIESIVLQ